MAIITCPECKKEISDKSISCVFCGCPSSYWKNGTIIVDDSNMQNNNRINETKMCINCGSIVLSQYHSCPNCGYNFDTHELYTNTTHGNSEVNKDIISCPRCKSTAITTGSRGFSLVWGFLGSGSTVNRCGKCGYSWEPKK